MPNPSLLAPGLYLVATPIGNLEDITLRALRVLASVDRIACEDTRQTAKLLSHFGLRVPTVSYHDHNETGRASELITALKAGARIAIVSDAGTPAIADPGSVLVREAIAAGVAVYPIPGANAALSGLIASGLSTESFAFHGFLPAKEGARKTVLEALRLSLASGPLNPGPWALNPGPATHLFYETPHRILGALEDVVAVFGPQHRIALARELTKLHEEFLRGTAAEVLATLSARPSIRGEMVLMLDGTLRHSDEDSSVKTIADEVTHLIRTEGLSEKDALKRVAKSRGLGKSEAYREWQRSRR
ncbi:16S rRNA (cytidine(1402)-2'-O)-methyltransferase [Bryocella elongata]|uniref:16S rRNA (cytidine(1402)-2'-O)-methyltransferase n=1 Tax=Bryocella elongata TaxID=863522 RepID=UPI000CDEC482